MWAGLKWVASSTLGAAVALYATRRTRRHDLARTEEPLEGPPLAEDEAVASPPTRWTKWSTFASVVTPGFSLLGIALLIYLAAGWMTGPYFSDPVPPRAMLDQATVVAFADGTPRLNVNVDISALAKQGSGTSITNLWVKLGRPVKSIDFAVQGAPRLQVRLKSLANGEESELWFRSFSGEPLEVDRRADAGLFQVESEFSRRKGVPRARHVGALRARSYRFARDEPFSEVQFSIADPDSSERVVGDRAFVRPPALVISQPKNGAPASSGQWEYASSGTEVLSSSAKVPYWRDIFPGYVPPIEMRGSHLVIDHISGYTEHLRSGRYRQRWAPPDVDLRIASAGPKRDSALLRSGALLGLLGALVVEAAMITLRRVTRVRAMGKG